MAAITVGAAFTVLAVIAAVNLLAVAHRASSLPRIESLSNHPVDTTPTTTVFSTKPADGGQLESDSCAQLQRQWPGIFDFISRKLSQYYQTKKCGFVCEHAWTQVLATPSVWVRGKQHASYDTFIVQVFQAQHGPSVCVVRHCGTSHHAPRTTSQRTAVQSSITQQCSTPRCNIAQLQHNTAVRTPSPYRVGPVRCIALRCVARSL
jgi:hypothetical protein